MYMSRGSHDAESGNRPSPPERDDGFFFRDSRTDSQIARDVAEYHADYQSETLRRIADQSKPRDDSSSYFSSSGSTGADRLELGPAFFAGLLGLILLDGIFLVATSYAPMPWGFILIGGLIATLAFSLTRVTMIAVLALIVADFISFVGLCSYPGKWVLAFGGSVILTAMASSRARPIASTSR